jgi:hypothetical protein
MPTPNTYDLKNFDKILAGSSNIFHQTSLSNLSSILSMGAIYSPGTLWGMNPNIANSFYANNPRRLGNLQLRADRGFIDYVFCSFFNGVHLGHSRYGTVSIEIDKETLLNRECFIYLFNFVFSWPRAPLADKLSDLSTWNYAVKNLSTLNNNEVLLRRKIDLNVNDVKFHCFDNVRGRVIDILEQFGYSEDNLEVHETPSFQLREYEMDMIAVIDGARYKAILSTEDNLVSIFNVVSEEDADFLGRFSVDEELNIIEKFPMSGESHVIGRLLRTGSSGQSSATA